jgi:hypothetical protein
VLDGLEMDEQRMSAATLLQLAAWGALGTGLGWLYFGALAWNLRLFLLDRRKGLAVLVGLIRFLALGAAFYAASRQGAGPLLAMAIGLPLGRAVVLRRARREIAP